MREDEGLVYYAGEDDEPKFLDFNMTAGNSDEQKEKVGGIFQNLLQKNDLKCEFSIKAQPGKQFMIEAKPKIPRDIRVELNRQLAEKMPEYSVFFG